jgi:5'-nucleotidase
MKTFNDLKVGDRVYFINNLYAVYYTILEINDVQKYNHYRSRDGYKYFFMYDADTDDKIEVEFEINDMDKFVVENHYYSDYSMVESLIPQYESFIKTLKNIKPRQNKIEEILKKPLIYLDMDGVLADYEAMMGTGKYDNHRAEGFFKELPMIKGMKEAVLKLSEKYELHILSTAPWSAPFAWKEKREWIEDTFGELFFKKITLTHRKDLSIGDYLIDDRTANGAGDFTGEHIHFGTYNFPDWDSILKYLL